ncbi:hypothetical protein QEH68_06730 [Paenarthrobacter sp. OM7]|uniref:hypothetical protein n=1 Tax=Paenarthrobacter sp. OM7 TaxID=3041264 RepID=UPI0024682C46|nr:hypothetical protein [Paenarthrobacter sp. OM7]WGM21863.1 hypothetical protein QEH68_06730 [Paenarthrobacter sp. OM7]
MATRNQVTEPAAGATEATADPAIPDEVPGRTHDPRKRVRVYDKETKEELVNSVPETWLDGRFPRLAEVPSKKAGK